MATARHRTLLIFRVLQNTVVHPPFPVKQIELGLRTYMRGAARRHANGEGSEPCSPLFINAFPFVEGWDESPF